MPKSFKMKCDLCLKEFVYSDKVIFHCTSIIDGELNTHTHLCSNCFQMNNVQIPVLKRVDLKDIYVEPRK